MIRAIAIIGSTLVAVISLIIAFNNTTTNNKPIRDIIQQQHNNHLDTGKHIKISPRIMEQLKQ